MADGKPAGDAQFLQAGVEAFPLGVTASGGFYYSQDIAQNNAYVAAMDFETGKLLAKPELASQRLNDTISGFSWSPDGKTSVYVHRHPDDRRTLLVREGDSRQERELIPSVPIFGDWMNAAVLRWIPDGHSVLARGVGAFYRIDLRTSAAALVAKGNYKYGLDSSPDGRYFFTKGGDGIARIDTTSGEMTVIHKVGSMTHSYRLSPDGRQLVFAGREELKVVPADGGPARVLVATGVSSWGDFSTAWTPDGHYVLYTVEGNGPYGPGALWIVPAEGGQPRQTEVTYRGKLSEVHIHPDGKRFSYTVFGKRTEHWAMENFLPAAKAVK
jgi:Tol biopolymer transport system component